MKLQNEMQSYFNLRTLDERKEKIEEIISQLERMQKMNDPVISLDLAEVIKEYCLLIDNKDERLLQYDRALDLVQNTRLILKKNNQTRQLLRSYHLECFIKYYAIKYKDEDAYIQDLFDLGEKIIEIITQVQTTVPNIENNDYYSLGCVWRAYGFVLQIIYKVKELNLKQKRNMLKNARELAHKAVELSLSTKNRDTHILSTYIFTFVENIHLQLYGDKVTTEEDYIKYMVSYKTLFEIAHSYGAIDFEYLGLLNHARLNLERVTYAVGSSEKKKELLNEVLNECKNLEKYEQVICLPHLQFYNHAVRIHAYIGFVYFEVSTEKTFNYYIDEALKSAEQMNEIYVSGGMQSSRDKVELYHNLIYVYMMKAFFSASRKEKIEYLKKCEKLLQEDEKISASWSPRAYATWRDLSSIYLDLSKVERNQSYFKKCVYYAKKAYSSALETEVFTDAFFEVYKIAIIAEDYQDYSLSIKNYEIALQLIEKIIQAGKDYPSYHNLNAYLQTLLLGVKAKEEHRRGDYKQSKNLYHEASSLLESHSLYLYEARLYNVYSLFEEASMYFIEEKYNETLESLFGITSLLDETEQHYTEENESQFQSFMDRRAYELQQLFFESIKALCIAQSNILQSLIHRNTGNSEKALELLKKANIQLTQFTERNIHIAGYYSFANGLYGLENSELAIRGSEYRSAASYLASASDQFENASQILVSDERLRQLCEGLKYFCQGWMYALEIMRRSTDLSATALNKNFALAQKSFANAIKSLKRFRKTCNSVQGFEKLLEYTYYSILFQETEDPSEKNKNKDEMIAVLEEALQYFKEAEDEERYGFTRDLLATMPKLEDIREDIFKPLAIPFTPYTPGIATPFTPYAPVFETKTEIEPKDVSFVIFLNTDQAEVEERIKYTIRINSSASVHIKKIEGVFPKKGIKVVSGIRLAKKGTINIDRLLSPGQSIFIEITVRAYMPFYTRKNPQLIYFNARNEKCRAFTTPLTLQVYPKKVLKTGIVNKINEKMKHVLWITNKLGINVGEFPIIYHDINSYRQTLSEYFAFKEKEDRKARRSENLRISELPIQQMAFVDPLGDVNILYDMVKHLYPSSIASLLNIIIHEKFGHGFFYQYTTLGKKLLELEYHRKGMKMLMKELRKISDKYAIGVEWLSMTILIPNEGFSIWLTLKTFRKLLEKISEDDQQFTQQIYHEMERIEKMVFSNDNLNIKHEYFLKKYGAANINPYALGYDFFLQIEKKYGEQCVPKALEIAADISLTRRQISRMPSTIKKDINCADKRLEKIAKSHLKIEQNNLKRFENAVKKLLL